MALAVWLRAGTAHLSNEELEDMEPTGLTPLPTEFGQEQSTSEGQLRIARPKLMPPYPKRNGQLEPRATYPALG